MLSQKDLKSAQTLVPPKKKKETWTKLFTHPNPQKQPGLNFVDYATSAEALSQREPKSQILWGGGLLGCRFLCSCSCYLMFCSA